MEGRDIPRKPLATVTVESPVATAESTHTAPSSHTVPESASTLHSQHGRKQSWWKSGEQASAKEIVSMRLEKEFNGKKTWKWHWFQKPARQLTPDTFDSAAILESDDQGRFIYRNLLGETYHKNHDVATYLSPTRYVPRRLEVQASAYVWKNNLPTGDWRRVHVNGSAPRILRVAEWALRPSYPDRNNGGRVTVLGRMNSALRVFVVGLPLQIMMATPLFASWEDESRDSYPDFPGYHWKWPKHATNPLDMRPSTTAVKKYSSSKRLLRPRQLVVLRDNEWVLDSNPDPRMPYLFISYANMHFETNTSETGKRLISAMAAFATLHAGKTAYWLDYVCRAPIEEKDLLDSDVYRMCDVIRGADRVVVMLQGNRLKLVKEWGSRMWTLPEALLAPGNRVYFCHPSEDTFKVTSLTKVEIASSIWEDPEVDGDDGPTRLLAEHFTGQLTLSRLEFISNSITALSYRSHLNYHSNTNADVAYALMGLLHYRIEKDPGETLFQAIARLSLANDNDQLIERMVCLFPKEDHARTTFEKLSEADAYKTHLWDIEPLCQVVGVADEDNTVLLDGCRAMHIRWKGFPLVSTRGQFGMIELIAEIFVRSGAWWFLFGINLLITYAPFLAFPFKQLFDNSDKLNLALECLIGGFFAIGLILSFAGPYSVRRLYGGHSTQGSPNLVGFEGVMPIAELEKLIFGNHNGRLSYAASSTPFILNHRDPHERVGIEPSWIASGSDDELRKFQAQEVPAGHHIFTLVDTGSLTVSIFSAERPPTVALLCGKEGGMLRAVLCSWKFGNDCLHKETVIRMPTHIYDDAKAKSWLKLCLGRPEVSTAYEPANQS